MSDNTKNINSGEAVQSSVQRGEQRRVRKGAVRIKRQTTTEAVQTEASSVSGSKRKRDVSAESSNDISDAQKRRLARKERRLERQEIREVVKEEKTATLESATGEEKEAQLEALSAAKIKREQRRAERKERRTERAERRTERSTRRKQADKLSSKEKLSGLFGKDKSSAQSSKRKREDSDDQHSIAASEKNDLEKSISQNEQLGTETVGAGQLSEAPSAVDRISQKLGNAKKDKAKLNSEKAAARLNRVLKKVTPKTAAKKAKIEAEKAKELTAEEKFQRSLTANLQEFGARPEQFQKFEMKDVNPKFRKDVDILRSRAQTCSIRVVEKTLISETSIKSAAQNVGHIFNQNLSNRGMSQTRGNQSPYSPAAQELLQWR